MSLSKDITDTLGANAFADDHKRLLQHRNRIVRTRFSIKEGLLYVIEQMQMSRTLHIDTITLELTLVQLLGAKGGPELLRQWEKTPDLRDGCFKTLYSIIYQQEQNDFSGYWIEKKTLVMVNPPCDFEEVETKTFWVSTDAVHQSDNGSILLSQWDEECDKQAKEVAGNR